MNYIKIYKGTSVNNANLLQGVDLDTFTLTTTLDETFDTGMFNVVTNDANTKSLRSRDYITIVEYENYGEQTQSIVHQEIYIVDCVGSTIIKKIGNTITYEYQVSFIEKTSELQNILAPNTETCQPLPPLFEVSGTTEVTSKISGVAKYVESSYLKYGIQGETDELSVATTIQAGAGGSATIVLPIYQRRRWTRTNPRSSWTPVQQWTNGYYYIVKNSSGTEVQQGEYSSYIESPFTLTPDKYSIYIYFQNSKLLDSDEDWKSSYFFSYNFEVISQSEDVRDIEEQKKHTTYEVLQKLLFTIKPYKTTNAIPTNSKYSIHSDCDFMKNLLCPDMFFTTNDLFQNLLLLGRSCNSIPYLDDNNAIHFMRLDSTTSIPNGFSVDGFNSKTMISDNERCGAVVSELQNMIPDSNISNNAVYDVWRTLECETGNQFTPDSAFYRTDFPMYQLKDFRVKYWNSNNEYQGEVSIFKYMFESSVYNCLDSTSNLVANSRAKALCWSQYSNKITGFTFTSSEYQIYQSLNYTAICNILKTAFALGSVTSDLVSNWHKRTMFQAVYVPLVDARLKTFRADTKNFNDNEMALAQQCNLGSLQIVGDSMKHSLIQTGNDAVQQNTFVRSFSNVPEINQVATIDGATWKVSKVVRAFSNTGYDLAVCYSKDFNRISAHQSLATEKRWADVPMNSAIKRTINFDDYFVLTKNMPTDVDGTYTEQVVNAIKLNQMFKNNAGSGHKPHSLLFRLIDADGTSYPNSKTTQVGLEEGTTYYIKIPCIVGSYGNSIFFKATCKDNYSATNCIVERTYDGNTYYYTMDIPYSNELGEGKLLQLIWDEGRGGTTTHKWNNAVVTGSTYAMGGANNVYIDKGSREQLEFIWQGHFIKDSDDLVIGKGLAEFCNLILEDSMVTERRIGCCIIPRAMKDNETDIPSDAIEIGFRSPTNLLQLYPRLYTDMTGSTSTKFDDLVDSDNLCVAFYGKYKDNQKLFMCGRNYTKAQYTGLTIHNINVLNIGGRGDYPF